ncbi:MAG: UDP-N-acetylmuramate dehydrogenase [Phycisphaerales bacterium]|nr:UDP-N-acetylmuramate dehydrogenase [Phycisphaerales bacterium]
MSIAEPPVRSEPVEITHNAPIPTWFGIGGGADRFATPTSVAQLLECLRIDPHLRILGDGANLLVDDDGVGELVCSLSAPAFVAVEWNDRTGLIRAGAGANLPKLITESVRRGLGGIEGLGGIPASLGGAIRMNAGGAFGQIADVVKTVRGVDRLGRSIERAREQIDFSYRHSGLDDLIITEIELQLRPGDGPALRAKLKDVMEYKKGSQPMADRSAGCVFKNPTLDQAVPEIPGTAPGQRVSAGMLIDKSGGKGTRVGGASVSERHANFIVTDSGAKARDVITLMEQVTRRVQSAFGVTLVPEVVVWRRS